MQKYMEANVVFSKFARDYVALKKDLPIRPSEMGVLSMISQSDQDCTPLMLAEMFGVSKPMIAAHVQVLLKKGYIYKTASDTDKRSYFVRPTEKGKALAVFFETRQTEYIKTMEAKLGEAEFDTLVRLLQKAQTILETIKEV